MSVIKKDSEKNCVYEGKNHITKCVSFGGDTLYRFDLRYPNRLRQRLGRRENDAANHLTISPTSSATAKQHCGPLGYTSDIMNPTNRREVFKLNQVASGSGSSQTPLNSSNASGVGMQKRYVDCERVVMP